MIKKIILAMKYIVMGSLTVLLFPFGLIYFLGKVWIYAMEVFE